VPEISHEGQSVVPHLPPTAGGAEETGDTGTLPVVARTIGDRAGERAVRVSDDEREMVVERLRTATADGTLELEEFSDRVTEVYRSHTRGELEHLAADLPEPVPPPGPLPAPQRWTVGVLSGSRRRGSWIPADRSVAVAVVGHCQLDLTESSIPSDVQLRAVAVFGGIEVLVPEGVQVELGGFALFGTRSANVRPVRPGTVGDADAPVVRVKAAAFLGGVTVRTGLPRVP
jgi:hypothetical protein